MYLAKDNKPMETVNKEQREGLGFRVLKFLTPKRLHKFYTKEAFVAWNVSSWFTIGQVTVLQKCWPWIVTKATTLAALIKVMAKDIKDAVVDAILIGT